MSQLVQIGRHNFRFQCQPGCTNCCTQEGDVYLAAEDVPRIADYLGLTKRKFLARFCEKDSDGDLRLTNPPDKACHFLLEGGCSIHAAKPAQCRTFPFWPEHVRSKKVWKEVGRYCPGIGVGPILSTEQVRAEAETCRRAFPDFEVVG
jgi:Fe-S-cluster containining protein